jgi:nitronate monooxygenase
VSEAGGLGFLASGYLTASVLAERMDETRALTSHPFGVNVFVPGQAAEPSVYAGYVDSLPGAGEPRADDDDWEAKLALLADHPVVSFTFGCPPPDVIAGLRGEAWVTVTSPEEARQAAEAGADVLVVQGGEAGGHRGSFVDRPDLPVYGLLPLLQLIGEMDRAGESGGVGSGGESGGVGRAGESGGVGSGGESGGVGRPGELGRVGSGGGSGGGGVPPLVASGGIATAAGVAAVLAAGARAAQVGTAFLRCPEAGTHPAQKAALASDAPTALTRAFTGRLARGIQNRFMAEHPDAPIAYPEIHFATAPLRAAARQAGDADGFNLWAGEAHALAQEKPAAEVVADLTP